MKNLILAAFAFILIYNILFFKTDLGIGAPLLVGLFNLFYFTFRDKGAKNLSLATFSSGASILFAAFLGWKSNGIVNGVNFILSIFFSSLAVYFYKLQSVFNYRIPQLILTPLVLLSEAIKNFSNVWQTGKVSNNAGSKTLSAVIRGVLIAIPLAFVVLMLLSKADPIFSKLTSDLLNQLGERTVVSVILFVGLLYFGLSKISNFREYGTDMVEVLPHKVYELLIISGTIAVILGFFIFVQFNYFFSNAGERELLDLGIKSLTYSEYVKKGFFELVFVTVIGASVLIYSNRFLHKITQNRSLVQFVSTALAVELYLVLISAIQRLNLYQAAHGLTRARVFGFIFLIWLAIMLGILLFNVFQRLSKSFVFWSFLSLSILFMVLINVVDIDHQIAVNYKPSVNGEVDYYYLANLSPDAYESWDDIVKDSQKVVNDLEKVKEFSEEDQRKDYWVSHTLGDLDSQIAYLLDKYDPQEEYLKRHADGADASFASKRKWQAFNYTEYQAYQMIKKDPKFTTGINEMLDKLNSFSSKINYQNGYTIPRDRPTQPPLL